MDYVNKNYWIRFILIVLVIYPSIWSIWFGRWWFLWFFWNRRTVNKRFFQQFYLFNRTPNIFLSSYTEGTPSRTVPVTTRMLSENVKIEPQFTNALNVRLSHDLSESNMRRQAIPECSTALYNNVYLRLGMDIN